MSEEPIVVGHNVLELNPWYQTEGHEWMCTHFGSVAAMQYNYRGFPSGSWSDWVALARKVLEREEGP